jgi:DNA replication protein DnaC
MRSFASKLCLTTHSIRSIEQRTAPKRDASACKTLASPKKICGASTKDLALETSSVGQLAAYLLTLTEQLSRQRRASAAPQTSQPSRPTGVFGAAPADPKKQAPPPRTSQDKMSNNFTEQGIAVVKEAIQADNEQDYAKALMLYKRGIEVLLTGVKYEKNETAKQMILKRVEGYMKRAEDLKDVVNQQRQGPTKGGTGTLDKGKGEPDNEQSKLQEQLSSAIVTDKPNVKWDDVAGLEGAKEALKEAVILPRRFPQLFVGKRRPWRGILLFGPPGTGKSYLAKAVATEADAKFFAVSSSDLVSKWQGESERLVKNLFSMARQEEHAIIFVDEIDSLCTARRPHFTVAAMASA